MSRGPRGRGTLPRSRSGSSVGTPHPSCRMPRVAVDVQPPLTPEGHGGLRAALPALRRGVSSLPVLLPGTCVLLRELSGDGASGAEALGAAALRSDDAGAAEEPRSSEAASRTAPGRLGGERQRNGSIFHRRKRAWILGFAGRGNGSASADRPWPAPDVSGDGLTAGGRYATESVPALQPGGPIGGGAARLVTPVSDLHSP